MDELTIDGKTYVSSKRAAQISGYAKDYVGQLCREGRIEARTVGRSWYVLLSALESHRLKDSTPEPEEKKEIELAAEVLIEKEAAVDTTWKQPTYSPERLASMPSFSDRPSQVNKLYAPSARDMHAETKEQEALVTQMQDAWREWFDQKSVAMAAEAPRDDGEMPAEEEIPETVPPEAAPSEEEEVPVRVARSYEGDSEEVVEGDLLEDAEEEAAPIAVRRIPERREERPARQQGMQYEAAKPSPYGRYMVQAVFLALSIVALATALVGTDIVNVSGLDFLAGVEAIDDK